MGQAMLHLLLFLFATVSSVDGQSLVGLQVQVFDVPLPGMKETRDDKVQWSFRTPPAGICLHNVTLLRMDGMDGKMIAFQWSCNDIVLNIVMDSSVQETSIAYPLQETTNERMVTVIFRRYRRTIQLSIQGDEKVTSRLTSSSSDFLPHQVKLVHHPLLCMQSVTYNDLNLLGNTDYPSCDLGSYTMLPASHVLIYSGDVLNVSSVIPEVVNCYITPVSQLIHGRLVSDRSVLYKHDDTFSSEVVFFYIACQEDNSQSLLSLEITASEAKLTARVENPVVTGHSTRVDSSCLNVTRTSTRYSLPSTINYTLLSYMTHGSLSLAGSDLLRLDVFDQRQLDMGLLTYTVAVGDQAFEEVIDLEASAVGAPSISVQLTFSYEPSLDVRMQRLSVAEGQTVAISDQILNVWYGVSKSVSLEILVQPMNGKIVHPTSPQTSLDHFTGQDIVDRSVKYIHDGSETTFDSVTLGISPSAFRSMEKIAVLEIAISLVNDNAPVRNSSTVISVVDGKGTFLSLNDLSYIDADIDQSYGDITIESQKVSCGEIVRKKWLAAMSRFTQRDLSQGQVIFHHFGDNASCQLPLVVSDGSHVLSEVVEIFPIEYKQEINGTLSMNVSRNGETVLDSQVLHIASNTRVPPSEIVIVVKRLPLHGLIKSPNADRFTYQDVLDRLVAYSHLGTLSVSDTFALKIKIDGLVHNLVINVVIDTDADLLKPVVLRNFAVAGRVGNVVEITNSILCVFHQLAQPFELLYQVPTQLGQHVLEFTVKKPNGTLPDTSFTQEDINAGRVFYNFKGSSRLSTLLVSFRGVSTDLVFTPLLVTSYLTVQVTDTLAVLEGSVSVIQTMFITTLEPNFSNELISVMITRSPSHVSFFYNYTVEINTFKQADVSSGLISLRHDGSEGLSTVFSCKLRYPNAESEEQEVTIDVVPLNDHYPSFNATGELQPPVIYIGENTTLTNLSLLIDDADSDSDPLSLTYEFTSSQQPGGRMLRYGEPAMQFTQSDVNNMAVTFEHLGSDSLTGICYLDLNISDGRHSRHSILVMEFLEKNVEANDVVYQVFPTIAHAFTPHILQQQSLTVSDIKIRSEAAYGSIVQSEFKDSSISLLYIPSKDILPQLCNDVSDYIVDKITVTTVSDDLSLVETSMFHMNMSFLNTDKQSMAAFDITTSELVVAADTSAVITEDTISAAGLAHHFSVCNSMVRQGFLVTRFPQHCTISGLDSKFILWWDDILLSKYSVSCPGSDTSLDPIQQFVLKIALQQNERLWVLDKFDYVVPIRIDLPPSFSEGKLTCSVNMLQGYDSVTFAQDLVQCLGQETGLDTQLFVSTRPSYGNVFVKDFSSKSLTLRDVTHGKVRYAQTKLSKVDWFELTREQHGFIPSRVSSVVINVEPNVVSSSRAVVVSHEPIVLTTELLDASPLLVLSHGEATYWITRLPSFGKLVKRADRTRRNILEQFTHTDIVNELILYYPPGYLPDEGEDNFSYTLKSPGVQPADGIFTVILNQSEGLSTSSISKSHRPDFTSYDEPVITIVVVSSCVSVCVVTILVTVLCLRKVQRRRRKHLARQERINSEPRLILTRENGSYKLLVAGGDEFPVTSYTSPSSPTRQIDERACEVSVTVPQVRVTPLIDKDGTIYDLHDYVNCEDLPCPTPRATDEFSSQYGSHGEDRDGCIYHSIERLPPIRKPNYSC